MFFPYLYERNFILATDHQHLVALIGPHKPTPAPAENRLSRCVLYLRQFSYTINYRNTSDHSNADVLSRLPVGDDPIFDRKESTDDVDTVCAIETLSLQAKPTESGVLQKEPSRDATLTKSVRFTREGWPVKNDSDDPAEQFRQIADPHYEDRVVIPTSLCPQVLKILHECHSGIQRMKQFARTAVF